MQKPEPEIYHMALNRMSLDSEKALFIGDGGSQEHLGAARSGISSLLVTYFLDDCSEAELKKRGEGSTGTISHVRELLKHL